MGTGDENRKYSGNSSYHARIDPTKYAHLVP